MIQKPMNEEGLLYHSKIMNGSYVCVHYVVMCDNSDSFNRRLLRTLLKKCLEKLKWNCFLGPVLMASSVHVRHIWTNISRYVQPMLDVRICSLLKPSLTKFRKLTSGKS